MVKATVYKNPFKPADRDIITMELVPGESVETYIAKLDLPEDMEYAISLNGAMVPVYQRALTMLKKNDWLVVCPIVHGGDTFKSIIGIVLAVVAFAYIGPAVANFLVPGGAATATAAATLSWTLASAFGAAAFMAVGGMLLNSMFPQPTVDMDFNTSDMSTSQTYSWSTMQSLQSQGAPVPVVFGTVRTAGQILAEHVTFENDKQYYNALLSGGEGPIDSISDIRINDNPITNYASVVCETRLGTNDQTIIPYFGDAFDDKMLNYVVNFYNGGTGTWATDQTDGSACQGLEILIELPGGLYYMNDNGSIGTTSVSIEAQYRVVGETWKAFGAGTFTITAAQSSAIRRTYRIDNIPAAQYEVRVRGTAKSGMSGDTVSTRYSNSVYWSMLSGIIYDDFSRPNKTLVGIRALATDQLSGGRPTVTWLHTRDYVWVWDPNTLTYVQKRADNPAWAVYDLIHYCRRLKNINTGAWVFVVRGDAASRIIYADFLAWATFCDAKNLKVNLMVERAEDLWKCKAPIEGVGRGMALKFGTRWGCICDAPSDPVQMFTMGNIKQGSYREEYLSLGERANAVEITFTNAAKNYQRDSLTVYGDDYDSSTTIKNPTQITLNGITTAEQAYREGKYRLNINKYLKRIEAFEVDIDAIGCRIGDVVLLQHDVPLYGEGGRLVSATTSTVVLDKTVILDHAKTYQVVVRTQNDEIITRSVVVPDEDTETNTLTVSTPYTTAPQKYDIYAFGETDKVVKPVRILNIGLTREGSRPIVALEYNSAVYDEAASIPDIEYIDGGPWNVRSLNVSVNVTETAKIFIAATWIPQRQRYVGARVLCNGILAGNVGREERGLSWEVPAHGVYEIEVVSLDTFGMVIGTSTATINTNVAAQELIPASVASITISPLGPELLMTWPAADSSATPIQGYEIRRGETWATGQLAAKIVGKNTGNVKLPALRGTHKYWICAYNQYGYSPNPAGGTITMDIVPKRNFVYEKTAYEETGTLSGNGTRFSGLVVQGSALNYGAIKNMTWEQLKTTRLLGPTAGPVVVEGDIVDIGKPAEVLLSVVEKWLRAPDFATIWEYKASTDGSIWSEWSSLPLGKVLGQYWQFRLTIGGIGECGILEDATVIVDVPDQEVAYIELAVPVGGLNITFAQPFVNKPAIVATPINAALTPKITNVTTTGFTYQLYDGPGTTDTGGVGSAYVSGF